MSAEPIEVEFDIIKEPWNTYKLSDGSILRLRIIVAKFIRHRDPVGNISYGFSTQNIMAVSAKKENKGNPSSGVITPQEIADSIVEDVDLEPVGNEEWNEYMLKDGTLIKVKASITRVAKTNKFDAEGNPIYSIMSQPSFRVKLAPDLARTIHRGMDKGPNVLI